VERWFVAESEGRAHCTGQETHKTRIFGLNAFMAGLAWLGEFSFIAAQIRLVLIMHREIQETGMISQAVMGRGH
jgi:hypothetical protein